MPSLTSSIVATPELIALVKQSSSVRFVKILIENEKPYPQQTLDIAGSFEDDLMILPDVLQDNVPAFILARLDPPSNAWVLFNYVPDTASPGSKMLYASTRHSLLASLRENISPLDPIHASSKTDLTPDAYRAHSQRLTAPNPLSLREQEMADVRAAESGSAIYEGSRARANHVGHGVGFRWGDELDQAITELGRADNCAIIILMINLETETLQLKSSTATTITQISSAIPKDEPCYALFALPQTHSSSPRRRELVFIYSCPSSSPAKSRMLYSTGAGPAKQEIGRQLTSTAPTAILVRCIETSDPQELTENFLVEGSDLQDANSKTLDTNGMNLSGPNETRKPFARPKPQARRR